jgi:hypothetical protein
MRALYIAFCFVVGALTSYLAAPFIYGNSDAVNIFVTVYTVFAGFLVAVIAILGDPTLLPPGSWRAAENHRDEMENRLIRQTWLFSLYLGTIGLIFVGALLKDAPTSVIPAWVKHTITHIHLGLGVAAFLLSLALPRMLMQLQRTRVDAEIEKRRSEEGIRQVDG